MTILGIDLNDAALTGFAGDQVLFSEPGYALAPDGEIVFGADAWRAARRYPRRVQNRYWQDLADSALPTELGPARTSADLVHGHLAKLWQRHGVGCESASFAVPAYWTPGQLGLLLGIAHELSMPVAGFVDASVASSRREYPGRELLVLDPSLHGVALTRVRQDGRATLGERERVEGLGIEALERACVQFFAAGFLQAARFDPLHDAGTEQNLYDELYGWLARLSRQQELAARIEFGGHEFSATFRAGELASRLGTFWQPVLQRIRSLLPADRPAALQMPDSLTLFPGLEASLAALPGLEVFLLEPGAAARGARRPSVVSAGNQALRLLTALPWDQAPAEPPSAGPARAGGAERPTHLLAGSSAYRLTSRPFAIGTELVSGDYGVVIDASVAGVSRQHCTIQEQDGRLVLTDHSRFGTRLNGHLIDASAILQPGDVLAIGSPPREFRLVSEVGPDGAA